MALSSTDLALIRDEVGDAPNDATLEQYYAELEQTSWIPTALRVLRRRRGNLAQETTQVSIPGVIAVGMKSNLATIDRQIERLELRLQAEQPDAVVDSSASQSRIVRAGYR